MNALHLDNAAMVSITDNTFGFGLCIKQTQQ